MFRNYSTLLQGNQNFDQLAGTSAKVNFTKIFLLSLSSVRPRLALASRGLTALSKSVESRTRPVSSQAILVRDSRQMQEARVYSWHKNTTFLSSRGTLTQTLFCSILP